MLFFSFHKSLEPGQCTLLERQKSRSLCNALRARSITTHSRCRSSNDFSRSSDAFHGRALVLGRKPLPTASAAAAGPPNVETAKLCSSVLLGGSLSPENARRIDGKRALPVGRDEMVAASDEPLHWPPEDDAEIALATPLPFHRMDRTFRHRQPGRTASAMLPRATAAATDG